MIMGTERIPTLTIGMAHYDDYHGAYFTIQDIRKELVFSGLAHILEHIEFVVVDNNPDSEHGKALERLLRNQVPTTGNVRLIKMTNTVGTSSTRNAIIQKATSDFVLVMDCHVMLCPVVKVITKLFEFMKDNPDTKDLYTGPLVTDNMQTLSTHFNQKWSGGMWGQWGSCFECPCGWRFTGIPENGCIKMMTIVEQEEITSCQFCHQRLPELESYGWKRKMNELGYREPAWDDDLKLEIPSQGLGLFFTKRDEWLGFSTHSIGFGGEEGYIHEKYRQAGRKCWNLSFLKWIHRFNRPDGVKYPLTLVNKFRNYIFEFTELGMDIKPILDHFKEMGMTEDQMSKYVVEAIRVYDERKTKTNNGDI